MKHVYISKIGDFEQVQEYMKYFRLKTDKELIDNYNSSVDVGIVGVHGQGLHLIAMRSEFLKRFDKSPILLEENIIISLTDKIRQSGNNYVYNIKTGN